MIEVARKNEATAVKALSDTLLGTPVELKHHQQVPMMKSLRNHTWMMPAARSTGPLQQANSNRCTWFLTRLVVTIFHLSMDILFLFPHEIQF